MIGAPDSEALPDPQDGKVFGSGQRMLTLGEVCAWFNITERHVRRLVEREAIPYRKVGRLLRFPERELEEWSRPHPREPRDSTSEILGEWKTPASRRNGGRSSPWLPKSLIE